MATGSLMAKIDAMYEARLIREDIRTARMRFDTSPMTRRMETSPTRFPRPMQS
jgi:hypothetical protein